MVEKVVAFGGPIYECLTQYDRGDQDAFNVILDQFSGFFIATLKFHFHTKRILEKPLFSSRIPKPITDN